MNIGTVGMYGYCVINRWVQAIVQLMSERKDAHLIKTKKVESFFNCLASLMSREVVSVLWFRCHFFTGILCNAIRVSFI